MRRRWALWSLIPLLAIGATRFDVVNAQFTSNSLTPSDGEPAKTARVTVKKWQVEDFEPLLENGLSGRSFDRGKRIFKEASCFLCHTFADEGGSVGPSLTEAAGRFAALDVLLHTIEPSRVIPDAYVAFVIEVDDGRVLVGMVQEFDDYIDIVTDATNPERKVTVGRESIASMEKSRVSTMPANLIDTFQAEEILDLVAYLLSRNDRNHEMFKAAKTKK